MNVGSNRSRVAWVLLRRASNAAGVHKQKRRLPRGEGRRRAINESRGS